MKVGIIDYGASNILSVVAAATHIGHTPIVIRSSSKLDSLDALILPGVGDFSFASKEFSNANASEKISEFASMGKTVLGICLGMQLLGESSTENGFNSGLGLLRGVTKHLSTLPGLQKKERIPRMGWYEVSRTRSDSIGDLPDKAMLYFAHSYYMEDVPIAHQLFSSEFNNVPFCVGIRDQSIVGLQFHPEKSGELGLSLLKKILSSN